MPIPVTETPLWYGPERTGTAAVHHIGAHHVRRHNRIPDHAQPCTELAVVIAGRMRLEVEGAEAIALGGGSFAIVPAHRRFRSGGGANRCLVYWVGLGAGWRRVEEVDAELGADERCALDALYAAHALRALALPDALADAVAACFRTVHEQADPLLRRGSALILLGELRAALGAQTRVVSAERAAMAPALELIERRLDQPPQIAELARACGLGRSAFRARFRAATGCTPADFLLERRLERARELLARPGATVAATAAALGFSSPQYFATAFRRVYGCAPSDVRDG